MSYTTVYSGNTVNPANQSQNQVLIANSSNIQFQWPSNSSNSGNSLVNQMIFTVASMVTPGHLILPDATFGSEGFESILFNLSASDLLIRYFDGSAFFTLPAGATYYITLIDSSTQIGSWISSVWAGGASITSITENNPSAGFTISPTTVSGGNAVFTFALANTLASLETIGAGGQYGIPCLTSNQTLAVRTIVAGGSNITVTNGGGVAGNISLNLNVSPTFTSSNIGNITINGNVISSDISLGNIPTFSNVNSSLSAIINLVSSGGSGTFSLACADTLASNIKYTLPTSLPAQNNTVLAASSSGAINPQHYLTQGIAGAYVSFDGGGNTITSSVNIASMLRNGAGSFTFTFSRAFSSVAYMGIGNCQSADGTIYGVITYTVVDALHVNVFTTLLTGSPRTPTNFSVSNIAFFGQLS